MRIAILELGVPPRSVGGAEIQAWELARRLARCHQVTLIVRRERGEPDREVRENVILLRRRIARAPFRLVSHVLLYLGTLWRLRRELDAVISFRAYPNGLVSSIFHRLSRIPSYVSIRGLDWYGVRASRWGRACLRFALAGHTRVLVQSEATARDVAAAVPGIALPHVLSNGVDATSLRARGKAVLFVGGLNRHKGVHVLIEAMRFLDDLPLVIVGDGVERARLERQAEGLDVTFLGRVDSGRVLEVMASEGRVLVLPAVVSEAFPNVILQAMSIGLPAVSTRVPGGVPDLLGDDERGRLVSPDDPRALAEAIRLLYDDETLRASCAKAGLRYVERHAWSRVVSEWDAFLTAHRSEGGATSGIRGMRIFTAYNLKSRGGAFMIWRRLVKKAGELDVRICYAAPKPLGSDDRRALFTMCPCPRGAIGNLVYMGWLLALSIFRWWPREGDVVLSQGILYTLPMLPLRLKGARVVTVVHGDYFEELKRRNVARWVRWLAERIYEPMYRKTDRLLPVSRDLARRLEERHGVPACRIQVVHNSLPALEPSSKARLDDLREQLELDPNSLLLVYVGGLQPIKRVDRFLQLVCLLGGGRSVQALVVGNGPCRESLEQLARELRIHERTRFPGWQADVQPYIELADLLVICSDYEGCPSVLLEGMALGTPMVGSRVGGIPDILGDERLLFDPGIETELSTKVEKLLDREGCVAPWVREHLARRSEEFRNPWEVQVVNVCREVAAEQRGRSQ